MSTLRKASLLLSSSGMTLDSQVPWLRNLRSVCGPRGIALADIIDSQSIGPIENMPVSIRVLVGLEPINDALGASLALLARLSIICSELACSIHEIVEEMKLVKDAQEVVALNNLVESTFQFYSATVLQNFSIGCVRGDEPVLATAQAVFLSAFNMFDLPHLVANEVEPVLSVLEVLTCRKYGFLFKTWPRAVRTLYVRILQIVSVSHPSCIGDFVGAHAGSAMTALDLMNNALDNSAPHGGEMNIIRQLDRTNLLVSFAIGSLAGLVQVNASLMKDATYPVQPALPPLPDIVSTTFLQTSCWTLVQNLLANPPLTGASIGRWILTPPSALTGETPVGQEKLSTSKLDGITYISQQLRAAKCIYHMPMVSGAQIEWQEWFATIKGLIEIFPTMPLDMLITCLTSQIKTTDQRIFGWSEKCASLKDLRGSYTILDWLEHIQDQVISSVTTRKSAYAELCDLHNHLKHILDCVGLATKIKQLFKLLFPVLATKERDPCTWLQAIIVVHNLLVKLASSPGNHVCCRAWKMHDEYSHSADFRQYIKAELHSDNIISAQLGNKYLVDKCTQLIEAHEQYTQTTEVTAVEPKSAHILALNTGGYAGKRNRDKSQDSSKRISTQVGGDKKKRPTLAHSGSVNGQAFLDTLRKACANRPELYPPAIRNKCTSLSKLDKAACEAAILEGHCILCQEKHRYKLCPLLKSTGPAAVLAKQLLKEYHAIRKIENPK